MGSCFFTLKRHIFHRKKPKTTDRKNGGDVDGRKEGELDTANLEPTSLTTPPIISSDDHYEIAATTTHKFLLDSAFQECTVDIPTTTAQRYRLLNCTQFLEHKILQIEEFHDFPTVKYSAVSYVWRGNVVKDQRRTFTVSGAEDADPISVDVLRHICTASLQLGTEYIWLDRLCIMQTNREDKAWQISRMYRIYESCAQCIVLPGGLGRLVHLHEETPWIHRAWTLQEALAPEKVMVLFAWQLGPGECISGDEFGTVQEVIPKQSALSQLTNLVNACTVGEMEFTQASASHITAVPTKIFGSETPHIAAFGVTMSDALSDDPDAKAHAIWQCAFARTSSRPVDMVFSIMGLFGVSLDPSSFHKSDRLGATIALAQKILENGGRANWVGISFRAKPCKQISTFPEFPQTSVAGKALVPTENGLELALSFMDGEYPNSLGLGVSLPEGKMDSAGYLTFSSRAVRIVLAAEQLYSNGANDESMVAADKTFWTIPRQDEEENTTEPSPRTYAVLIGWFQKFYPGASLADGVKIRAMVIEEHSPSKFHVKTFLSLKRQLKDTIINWPDHTFSVGGPDPLSINTSAVHVMLPTQHNNNDSTKGTLGMEDMDESHGSMRYAEYFYYTSNSVTEDSEATASQEANRIIVSQPLAHLANSTVDINNLATSCRFRLVNVDTFLDLDALGIIEFLPPSREATAYELFDGSPPKFAAVSYPWRDLQLLSGQPNSSFSVAGALHADPISIDVLKTACVAARSYGCGYLWLDRLCILQKNREDKNWQIQRMYQVYKSCEVCIIFPGGLVRLAKLDDSTSWIDRAWTLQEALAPKSTKLVFQLSHPSFHDFIQHRCQVEGYNKSFSDYICHTAEGRWSESNIHGSFVEKVLEPDRSAITDLKAFCFHLWSVLNSIKFHAPELTYNPDKFPVRIMRAAEAQLLQGAVDFGGHRLWTAVYTRSSSRAVDMVLSIMQLFDVQLEVSQFNSNERIKAMIALIQVLMMRGSPATWLYIAPSMDPSKELSTLPEMPETSETGKAYIQTRKGRALAFEAFGGGGTNRWRTEGAPTGEMTDSGYFVFRGKGALMNSSTEEDNLEGNDSESIPVWAIIVGRFKNYNRNPITWRIEGHSSSDERPQGLYEMTLMLVKQHSEGLFHRIGMEKEIDERKTAEWNWTTRYFHVGGSGIQPRQRFGVSPSGPVYRADLGDEEDQDMIRADKL